MAVLHQTPTLVVPKEGLVAEGRRPEPRVRRAAPRTPASPQGQRILKGQNEGARGRLVAALAEAIVVAVEAREIKGRGRCTRCSGGCWGSVKTLRPAKATMAMVGSSLVVDELY